MEELNRAWKKTSIVVLGDEVGELFEYVDWLGGAAEFMSDVLGRSFKSEARSALTGKKVYLFAPFYSSHARFVEMEKIPEIRIDPLSIDEIKDIDSIFEALKERWFYRASVVLGNSSHVEKSDSVLNSHFVLESQGVEDSSYVAYSTWIRDGSKYVFGSMGGPGFQFSIRNFYGAHLKRALEAYFFIDSSDLYYTHRMVNSSECMFSFNLYGEHYVIGNLRLPKERYFK